MAIFLIFACAIVILIFILPYWLIPANPFSEPSGKWQVGTTDLIWDKPDLSGIIAKVWYPTDVKNNTSAPYIDDPTRKVEQLGSQIITQQASNISMVLDKIIDLNYINDLFLHQKINTSKIFAAGHSVGGSSSFVAYGMDRRISKGINFDGYFFDNDNTNYLHKELLLINADRDRYPKNKTLRSKYECDLAFAKDKVRIEHLSKKSNLKQLVFQLTDHLNFCDLPLIVRPTFGKAIGFIGDRDGRKLLTETAAIAINFFDRKT
jgi:Platelet-activating factor acetylhydrolase, isoform II